jgi:dual specificity MAP kinase phosphatase
MEDDIDQITETIYLGNIDAAFNKKKLKQLGIKKVLTVMSAFGNHYSPHEFIHKSIDVDDDFRTNIICHFKECILFIEGKDKIFVHCAAGMSRSPTIVIAYIMWKRKLRLNEAIKFVKEKRSIISPNDNFMNQLKIFEELLIKNDYNINNINFKKIKVNDSNCILF